MAWILGFFALLLLCMGVLEIFSPKAMNAILRKLAKEGVLKVLGAVTNLLGALLLWLTAVSMPEHGRTSFVTIFAAVFGAVCVLKGLGLLLMSARWSKTCEWMAEKPDWLKRAHGIGALFFAGLFAFALGTVLKM